jgi:DNA processing protein
MTTICGLPSLAVEENMRQVMPGVEDAEMLSLGFARAAWSTLIEPGDRVAGTLISVCGAERALQFLIDRFRADEIVTECAEIVELDLDLAQFAEDLADGIARWQPRLNSGDALNAVSHAAKLGAFLITPEQELWPAGLNDLGMHAPLVLWGRGQYSALTTFQNSLAVVGARASTGYGEHVTMETVSAIAEQGVSIVSGAAYGIDGMAHRSALAVGGTTMAFLAGGVDRFYPSGHDALLGRIMESGLVLAEAPCGYAPTKWRFLLRNRLIAASTQATVVMEAGWRSGSLNTANHAATLGRPLGVVPGPVTSASSAGCHRLLREYDAVCVTTASEMLELLPGQPPALSESELTEAAE